VSLSWGAQGNKFGTIGYVYSVNLHLNMTMTGTAIVACE
jgi:hypothetical protein